MIRWLRVLGTLTKKEWQLEIRGRELLTLLLCNAMLMAVLVGAGVSSAVLTGEQTTKIFPMLLWVVFLLSSATSVARFNEQELEGRAFEGLLLAGVTGSQMYLSKWLVLSSFLALSFMALVTMLSIALDVSLSGSLSSLFVVGVATSTALAALLVLLAAVASTSKLKGVLLPIISLPLLFPVFLGGVEMTSQLVISGALDEYAPWPYLLLCANTIYLVAGINLFDVAIRE
jgi:ABC-type transport system involved in cytochrome c biogenesis permease component